MNYPYTGKRIGATLIDYLLVDSLTALFFVYFGEKNGNGYTVNGLATFLPFILWFVYFVVAEAFGGTLGHRIFKLRVVSMDGHDLRFRQILRRRICDILDICWCFGLLALLLVRNTQNHQRLGDILAGTTVIGEGDIFYRPATTHPHRG